MKTMQAVIVGVVSLGLAGVAAAADDPKLMAEAKVREGSARVTALARVPNGAVKSEELERENGHLIYSYDITVQGKSGIEEVAVDALTGKVLSVKHETAKDEGKEAAAEAKETKTKPAHHRHTTAPSPAPRQ